MVPGVVIRFVRWRLLGCRAGFELAVGDETRNGGGNAQIQEVSRAWYHGSIMDRDLHLCVIKCDEIDPDEVDHGGVPTLQRRRARCGSVHFGMSYSKYTAATDRIREGKEAVICPHAIHGSYRQPHEIGRESTSAPFRHVFEMGKLLWPQVERGPSDR